MAFVPLAIYRIQMFILLTSAGWGTQLNSTFAVSRLMVLAVLMIGLTACNSTRRDVEEIGNLQTSGSTASPGTETNMNCELKNGVAGCTSLVAENNQPTRQARIPLSEIPVGNQPPVMGPEPAPVVQAFNQTPRSTSVDLSAEGCVWQNRAYSAGESIYHTDGPLIASEIFIRGQTFSQLAGVSPDQRYQQCQCSSSSGHWGCV